MRQDSQAPDDGELRFGGEPEELLGVTSGLWWSHGFPSPRAIPPDAWQIWFLGVLEVFSFHTTDKSPGKSQQHAGERLWAEHQNGTMS